jgi:hypothetical protein
LFILIRNVKISRTFTDKLYKNTNSAWG